MMPVFVKKPVAVEAFQLPPIEEAMSDELGTFLHSMDRDWECGHGGTLIIHTLEGDHEASPGDYIIKGIKGEYYPCKPDIFEQSYYTAAEYAELTGS